MGVTINFQSGTQDRTGYVRVGSSSSQRNPDATWLFNCSGGSTRICQIVFHFNWNNTAAGTGWATNDDNDIRRGYRARIADTNGNVLYQVNCGNGLSGSSGSWSPVFDKINLEFGKTYQIRLNNDHSAYQTMKSFSISASSEVVITKCAQPTSIRLNGTTNNVLAKPGAGVQMEIIGGGGGINNAFQKWYIQELIYAPGQGELSGWRRARNGNDQEDYNVCNPTGRTVTVYPTPVMGQRKRFRIRAEGIPDEAYHSDYKEMGPSVFTNQLPHICTNVTPDKTNILAGGILRLTFSGGGDPDGNLWMYQARVLDENGNVYGGEELGRQYDLSKNYVDLDLGLDPNTFCAGTKWKFMLRGHDGLVGGAWSEPTAFVQIGGIAHINDENGAPRDAIPYVFDSTGAPKQALPYCFDANGAPKMGI